MAESAGASRPTLLDVGKVVGVSPTTVSLVLSGRDAKISAETRARVLAAVEQLGYRPNRAAQSLRLGQSHTIGFITEDIATHNFSGPLISGIHDTAWERNSLMLMVNTTRNPSRLKNALHDLLDRQVDSVIYASVGTRKVAFPSTPKNVPVLLVNAFTKDDRIPAVLPDEEGGGRAAVEHLLGLGHERIAFLTGRPGAWATKKRIAGFRAALVAADRDPDEATVLTGNYRLDSGYELTYELMSRKGRRPTALIMGNDQMAGGAYLALARLGIRVPEQVSVVGYDDEPLAADIAPSLTTVRLPFYEMGRLAATHALSSTVSSLPARTLLPCPLVQRSSTLPPPGQ
ncbi:LacI family DNA-binding transcriptional regulator [Propionicicella superfundia]|uniref:LacI family DNA-binding transcriptional regulator n=1 Tax=Propionicicella superfundia TaxID=348582 RepID=UPI0004157A02|nr:LacI family DNA-binding transcriptional regulator [Propionicicella superfundia]